MRADFAHAIAERLADAYALDAAETAAAVRFALDVKPETMAHPLALARRLRAAHFDVPDPADVAQVIGATCRGFARFARMQLTLPGLDMVPQPCQLAQANASPQPSAETPARPCPATGGNMLAFWACYRQALNDAKAIGKLPVEPSAQVVADRAKAHVQAKGWGVICLDRKSAPCLWAAARKMGLRKGVTAQRDLLAFLEGIAAEMGVQS